MAKKKKSGEEKKKESRSLRWNWYPDDLEVVEEKKEKKNGKV